MTNTSGFPISVESLQASLPHRPPMVWVNRVLSADLQAGECEVVFSADGPQSSSEGLRQSTLVEWMAQSFGYAHACVSEKAPKQAYLAAMSGIEYCDEAVWKEFVTRALQYGQKHGQKNHSTRAFVTVKVSKTLGPITLVTAQVRTETDIILAKGSFKVFGSE